MELFITNTQLEDYSQLLDLNMLFKHDFWQHPFTEKNSDQVM